MKTAHVKKLFADWSEKRLDEASRQKVEAHLQDCPECRSFYDKMTALLAAPDVLDLPALTPDPFLPTRIRETAKNARPEKSGFSGAAAAQWGFSTLMLTVAIYTGIYLGKDFATVSETDDTNLLGEVSQALYGEDLADSWEYVLTNDDEGNDEN